MFAREEEVGAVFGARVAEELVDFGEGEVSFAPETGHGEETPAVGEFEAGGADGGGAAVAGVGLEGGVGAETAGAPEAGDGGGCWGC